MNATSRTATTTILAKRLAYSNQSYSEAETLALEKEAQLDRASFVSGSLVAEYHELLAIPGWYVASVREPGNPRPLDLFEGSKSAAAQWCTDSLQARTGKPVELGRVSL